MYDVAVAYHQRRAGPDSGWQVCPPFWDTIATPDISKVAEGGYRFEVNVRRFAMEGLPEDEKELARWIEQRWVEKGEWLERKRVEWEREDREVFGKKDE